MPREYKIRTRKADKNQTCFCGKEIKKGEQISYVLKQISERCHECVVKYIAILNRVLSKPEEPIAAKGGKAGSFHKNRNGRVIRGSK